jgi:UDP-N-acetyl-D-mannosaminuronic acid dehydrogenase
MKISKKNKKICIIGGAGHVGLPLSFLLASKKFDVVSVDIDEAKILKIKNNILPFIEDGLQELINRQENFKLKFTNKYEFISNSKFVFITLGTPIDEYFNPDFQYFYKNLKKIMPYLRNGQILILRSTIFPGTTRKIQQILKDNNLKIGIAFCPERISQGNGIKELLTLPQIIGTSDQKTFSECCTIFKSLKVKILQTTFEEGEVAKLFCNTWRYLKFAIANQFYSICKDKNINFQRVRHAMMYNYDRAKDFPNSGFAAGPCLLKDTMQLSAYSRQLFTFGHSAMLVNETLPEFLINNLKKNTKIQNRFVGILGMAFKPNNDDIRDSLAYKLKKKLEHEGCKILCSDIYIKDKSFVSTKKIIEKCSIIFIGCPHDDYKKIKFKNNTKIVDCWGFYPNF